MADRFVTLAQLHDPVGAELAIDLLEQSGIPVTSSGLNHRAMLGMLGSYVEITLQVPESRLEEARALLDALDHAPSEESSDVDIDGATPDAAGPERASAAPRLKRVAAFAALALTFGAGHFYARSYQRAIVLLFSELFCVVVGFGRHESIALYFIPLIIAADLAGSFEAVDRWNGITPRGASALVARTLPWIVPAIVLAPLALRHAAPAVYVGSSGRAVCDVASRCAHREPSECVESLATRIAEGRLDHRELSACAECLDGLACPSIYDEVECEGGACASPQLYLRPQCADTCRGVLPRGALPFR